MNKNSMLIVGLDLGDKYSYITIVDQDGELIEESRLPTTEASFQHKFSALQPCRLAMEVGTHSRWASHLLTELGHDVLVANARKLRAIYHNPRKGDRADAETLARLARLDPTLPPDGDLRLSPVRHIAHPRLKLTWPWCDHGMSSSVPAPYSSTTPEISSKPLGRVCPLAPQTALLRKPAPICPSSFNLLWPRSLTASLPSPNKFGPTTKRSKPSAVNATLKPSYSVLSAAWAHSRPWAISSRLKSPIASAGAGRSVLPSVSSPHGINPEIAIPNYASQKRETPTYAACLLDPHNTS
jgi:hypothetical protein